MGLRERLKEEIFPTWYNWYNAFRTLFGLTKEEATLVETKRVSDRKEILKGVDDEDIAEYERRMGSWGIGKKAQDQQTTKPQPQTIETKLTDEEIKKRQAGAIKVNKNIYGESKYKV